MMLILLLVSLRVDAKNTQDILISTRLSLCCTQNDRGPTLNPRLANPQQLQARGTQGLMLPEGNVAKKEQSLL